ncbi:inverse autotransporter beta domain-containing protein [Frischella perrara]|uniref:inverse autotransporter beta domain-containing protein n=1 Tax=Frischella perrara TaxID=1267021 RepID=UPI0023F02D5B|nr:inverse autotransporter beta domain-containing protein [Frischella perrara]
MIKRCLNLTTVATLVIATLSYNFTYAQISANSSTKNYNSKNTNDDVRIFINNQQRSLYQIALLSGISIMELRELNKGDYDNIDVVKVGDSIVLPANSPLLPALTNIEDIKEENKYNLPSLGSTDVVDSNVSDSDVLETHLANTLQFLGQQDWENMSSRKIKEDLQSSTRDYAENYVRSQVHNQVIDPIQNAAQDFLSLFGTAQLSFDVSDQARLNNVNVKLFSPWYDSDNTLIFSQLTYQQYEHDRRIGNFGIGQRWDVADKSWLLGYNVFFDHDFKRNHNRLGFGLEAWSDYMKFAANYYMPLSDWKNSKDFDNYLERAARGFDVRFQGYLPSYPHLGASLMFEQYFGKKVALFGKDRLQKDPYAVTIGIDYTPVPLFTIKGEHKQGQDSKKQAKVEMTMNYRIGVPLKDQLDPDMVQVARSLKGSRYDLVDRNNFIVLEYKEKKFSVDLASLGEFEEGTIVPLSIAVHHAKDGVTISPSSWNKLSGALDLNALFNGGDICYNRIGNGACQTGNSAREITVKDTNNWSILVPPFLNNNGQRNPVSSTTKNSGRYEFDITVTDGKGKTAQSNTTWLSIKPSTSRRTVQIVNISDVDGTGQHIGSSATTPVLNDGNELVKLEVTLFDNQLGSGFNDTNIFNNYPNSFDIDKINQFWSAVTEADNKKVKFIDGSANNAQCPVNEDCLLVKSVKAVSGSPDKYQLEIATTSVLNRVNFTTNMAPYGSATLPIYFGDSNNNASWLAVFNQDTGVMVAYGKLSKDTNSIIVTPDASNPFIVDSTYEARAYNIKPTEVGANVINAQFAWSLVGDNKIACPVPNNTVLDDFNTKPNGPWFNVSTDNTYTIKGLANGKVSLASNGSAGLAFNKPWGVSHPPLSKQACAGDQGFKLQVTIY